MIKEKIVYEVFDGNTFNTVKEAEQHVVDIACEHVNGLFKPLVGKFTHSEIYTIIIELVGDKGKLISLSKSLNRLTEYN